MMMYGVFLIKVVSIAASKTRRNPTSKCHYDFRNLLTYTNVSRSLLRHSPAPKNDRQSKNILFFKRPDHSRLYFVLGKKGF